MWKPIVYEDNLIDRMGSRSVYGLNAQGATFNRTDSVYSFTPSILRKREPQEQQDLEAFFTPVGNWTTDWKSFPLFEEYVSINTYPWLCNNILGQTQCAMNIYDWQSMHMRPVSMEMTIHSSGVVPLDGQYPMKWNMPGINQPFGTVEVVVVVGITNPNTCPNEN